MKLIVASALDGLDRTTRSWQMLEHLQAQDHTVAVAVSGRGAGALQEDSGISRFFGIDYRRAAPHEDQDELNWRTNKVLYARLDQFQPDLMLLDGEPFAARVAHRLRIPIVSIDHLHFFEHTRLDIPIPTTHMEQLLREKERVKARKYTAQQYLLPLFFPTSPGESFVHGSQAPIRSMCAQLTPTDEGHFAVYAWPHIRDDLSWFQQFEQEVRASVPVRTRRSKKERVVFEKEVAGSGGLLRRRRTEKMPRQLDESEQHAQLPEDELFLNYQVADEQDWLTQLASARAAVLDGEMTAIAEAIALQKPMLLIPHPKRFDQWCYAHYVEKMGFGEFHPRLTRSAIDGFLERLPRYQANLQAHEPQGPTFLEALDQLLARGS